MVPGRAPETDSKRVAFRRPTWRAKLSSRFDGSTVFKVLPGPSWTPKWSPFGSTLGAKGSTIFAKGGLEGLRRESKGVPNFCIVFDTPALEENGSQNGLVREFGSQNRLRNFENLEMVRIKFLVRF